MSAMDASQYDSTVYYTILCPRAHISYGNSNLLGSSFPHPPRPPAYREAAKDTAERTDRNTGCVACQLACSRWWRTIGLLKYICTYILHACRWNSCSFSFFLSAAEQPFESLYVRVDICLSRLSSWVMESQPREPIDPANLGLPRAVWNTVRPKDKTGCASTRRPTPPMPCT